MENFLVSAIIDTDSYKFSHWLQYPEKTNYMHSYLESRGGEGSHTMFFGLQYILKRYFSNPITVEMVEEGKEFAELHGVPFNYEGWMYIATELKGKLPVIIKAVKEGSIIPKRNALMTVESTDPKVFWIVSWLETALVRLWYPISVATRSYEAKKMIREFAEMSIDDDKIEADMAFKLHDFGSRGTTCLEAAGIGGMAHLINFKGSDTITGIYYANKFYDTKMAGYSIPASEHSTITMWGKENESKAYANMIKQYGDSPIFACVSDSYDIYNATSNIWGDELKQQVMDMNATLVVRPDSGDAVKVPFELVKMLAEKFGTTVNKKGYKVLNKVKVIQGDGIGPEEVRQILDLVTTNGFSAENINFGMGGGLLQKGIDRDTHKFAFKCSYAEIDGEGVAVFKSPVTDAGKKSKIGKLALVGSVIKCNGKESTLRVATIERKDSFDDLLLPVFVNGELVQDNIQTFDDVIAATTMNYLVY